MEKVKAWARRNVPASVVCFFLEHRHCPDSAGWRQSLRCMRCHKALPAYPFTVPTGLAAELRHRVGARR